MSKGSHDFLTHVFTLSCYFILSGIPASLEPIGQKLSKKSQDIMVLQSHKILDLGKMAQFNVDVYVTRR